MKALLKVGGVGLAALILAACASEAPTDPNAGKVATKYPALNAQLAPMYAKLAADEAEEGDDADAAHYRAKSADAAAGFEVLPDTVASCSLDAANVSELSEARVRLMQKYTEGYAESQPADLATAQTQWDCWIQEQEEGWQLLHIFRCRDGFEAAMAKMQPAPAPAPAPKPEPRMSDTTHTIYFRFDQANLTNLSKGRLQSAIGDLNKRKAGKVSVTAHTDTSGSDQYNLALSNQRARQVVEFLTSNGIAASAITASGVGESQPAVETGDGVKNAKNRRAVLVVSGQ